MKSRLPVDKIAIYLLLAFLAYVIADLGILSIRDRLLPSQPPPPKATAVRPHLRNDRIVYNVVTNRNIFNADQKIPDALGSGPGGKASPDAAPVPSSLAIQLVGTIVHINPARSVATINLKTKNDQVALRVADVIPDNLGTITKIERNRVILRNNATQRLEYIEMKDDIKLSFGAPKPIQNGEVTKTGETEFEIKRTDINRLTGNLPELLQQARAVPRLNANGGIDCFSLAEVAQGSIYERLGIKKGDCIKSVNGERIDSPAKAMELYNALRGSASAISLGYERDGHDENNTYNITQ